VLPVTTAVYGIAASSTASVSLAELYALIVAFVAIMWWIATA
jgi:hypothetical protein